MMIKHRTKKNFFQVREDLALSQLKSFLRSSGSVTGKRKASKKEGVVM